MNPALNDLWYLQQIDIFKGITDNEILEISNKVTGRNCSKKEFVYTPGESDSKIYILKKGEITLYSSHKGKKFIIEVLKPGSIFGNLSFDNKDKTHFAEASKDSYMCVFSIEDFLEVLKAKPEVMLRFMQVVSEKLQSYEEKIKDSLLDAKSKIKKQIIKFEHAELKRKENLLGKIFGHKTKLTHEKLSELTGLSRETVTRCLSELKKEGIYI